MHEANNRQYIFSIFGEEVSTKKCIESSQASYNQDLALLFYLMNQQYKVVHVCFVSKSAITT